MRPFGNEESLDSFQESKDRLALQGYVGGPHFHCVGQIQNVGKVLGFNLRKETHDMTGDKPTMQKLLVDVYCTAHHPQENLEKQNKITF